MKLISAIFAYIGVGWIGMRLYHEFHPPKAALYVGAICYLLGWIFVVMGVAGGSAKFGLQMVRYYVAAVVAISIVGVTFAFLPNIIFLIGSVALAGAVAGWIATGKWVWEWWG